jgi:hypothetical protein
MTWHDLETAAPEIGRLGKERLDEARVALLATLRSDGSPRISPVEPYLSQGHLLFGAMPWSPRTQSESAQTAGFPPLLQVFAAPRAETDGQCSFSC